MNCLKAYGSNRFLRGRIGAIQYSSDESKGPIIPEEPTTCCMSGCANCVWIDYAHELTKLFKNGGEKVKEIVMSKVSDPNMRAFLLLELRNLEKKKKDETE